jgi:hypothetical protein
MALPQQCPPNYCWWTLNSVTWRRCQRFFFHTRVQKHLIQSNAYCYTASTFCRISRTETYRYSHNTCSMLHWIFLHYRTQNVENVHLCSYSKQQSWCECTSISVQISSTGSFFMQNWVLKSRGHHQWLCTKWWHTHCTACNPTFMQGSVLQSEQGHLLLCIKKPFCMFYELVRP